MDPELDVMTVETLKIDKNDPVKEAVNQESPEKEDLSDSYHSSDIKMPISPQTETISIDKHISPVKSTSSSPEKPLTVYHTPETGPFDPTKGKIVESALQRIDQMDQSYSPSSDKSLSVKSTSPVKNISPIMLNDLQEDVDGNINSPLVDYPKSAATNGPKSVYVSRIDAGIAILLSQDLHLIEWPVTLLPQHIEEGMYFDLNITENNDLKNSEYADYLETQKQIEDLYAADPPYPSIKCHARGHAIQLEILNSDKCQVKYVQIYLNDSQYKKQFQVLSKDSILINVEQERTYTIYIKAKTPNGLLQSNIEEIQVV